jgi:hypothetical protein
MMRMIDILLWKISATLITPFDELLICSDYFSYADPWLETAMCVLSNSADKESILA